MVEDKQTHTVPTDAGALDRVARLHGLDDGQALLALLEPHVARVGAAYDKLDEADDERLPRDVETLEERLARAGFDDPIAARLRVESWRSGKARSLRASTAREAFEAMLPALGSEERRVGKACVSTCRSRWSPFD